MSSPGRYEAQSANPSRIRLPGPKKGIQRRKDTAIKEPTPIFVPRNAIADPKIPRPSPRQSAKCANPSCVKPEIVDDNGTKVCATCGTVARDDNIVSEITFGENSAGAAVVQGTFVGADQRHGRGGLGPRGFHGGDDSPNRAQTIALAKATITGVVGKLGLPSNIIEQSVNIFQLAQYQMVQGRSIRAVAAVCLYVACRRPHASNAHHIMLIDIAEHINFNVFMLGSIFTKMVRKVKNLGPTEAVNPENLILRFARALEFGRETNRIVAEATRIVQRMKRDWMVTGRRPSGICGAALIIAARMNNFRRTVREMVYVVKVTEITINKRLEEFKVTDTSKFTVDEFRTTDLDSLQEHDPPSFYLAQEGVKPKRGRKRKAPETADEIEGEEYEDEDAEDSEQTPPPTQKRRIDKDGFAIPDIPIDPALQSTAPRNDGPIHEALTLAVNDAISEMERDESTQLQTVAQDDDAVSVASTDTNVTASTTISETTGLPRKGKRGRPKGSKNKGPLPLSGAELALEAAIENEISSGLDQISRDPEASRRIAQSTERTQRQHHQQPTPPNTQPSVDSSSQAKEVPQQVPKEVPMTSEIDPSEFDSDPEVANCLLTPAEREIKERIWVHENNSWLREQHRKKIQAQLRNTDPNQNQMGRGKPRKNRRPRLGDPQYLKKDGESGENAEGEAEGEGQKDGTSENPEDLLASSMTKSERAAGLAVKSMMENRGLSTRINYNVMQTLFPGMMAREGSIESRRSIDEKARRRERMLEESRSQTEDSRSVSREHSPADSSITDATRIQPENIIKPVSSSPAPAAIKPIRPQSIQAPTSIPSAAVLSTPPATAATTTTTTTAAAEPTEEEAGDPALKVLGTIGADEDESDVDPDIMGDMDDDEEDDEEDDLDNAFAGRYNQYDDDDEDDD